MRPVGAAVVMLAVSATLMGAAGETVGDEVRRKLEEGLKAKTEAILRQEDAKAALEAAFKALFTDGIEVIFDERPKVDVDAAARKATLTYGAKVGLSAAWISRFEAAVQEAAEADPPAAGEGLQVGVFKRSPKTNYPSAYRKVAVLAPGFQSTVVDALKWRRAWIQLRRKDGSVVVERLARQEVVAYRNAEEFKSGWTYVTEFLGGNTVLSKDLAMKYVAKGVSPMNQLVVFNDPLRSRRKIDGLMAREGPPDPMAFPVELPADDVEAVASVRLVVKVARDQELE